AFRGVSCQWRWEKKSGPDGGQRGQTPRPAIQGTRGLTPLPPVWPRFFLLLLVRQREHVEREALIGRINLRRNDIRNQPRTAPALSGRHGDVLFTIDAVRHGETLDRGCK